MKLLKIVKVPEAKIEFTPADIRSLQIGAATHYDYKCQQMAAVGGLIYGLVNRVLLHMPDGIEEPDASYAVDLCVPWHEVDLLAKVAESPHVPREIGATLSQILKELDKNCERES